MNRSLWNKAAHLPPPPPGPRKHKEHLSPPGNRSILEKLRDERGALIFRWVEAAELRKSAWVQRLSILFLAAGLLLAGMLLAANGMQARAIPAAPDLRLVFGVLASLAALLLALSIIFILSGLSFGAGSLPPVRAPAHLNSSPREQLIDVALAELKELEKAQYHFRRIFRWASILFIAAMIPYLVVVILLLV